MNLRKLDAALPAALLLALLAAGQGCGPSTELGGTPIPNALPDTRLTGLPPTLRESDFVVRFFWTGSDPDNRVTGFQWKMSDNGTDGIGIYDTLTVDPATGDTLHPWRFTGATDTTFIVKADLPDYPGDSNLPAPDRRSYQSHTLFVRAVDELGGVDPTPAAVSFTATTLVPVIIVDRPASLRSYTTIQQAPPTVTFGWTGTDPDFGLGVPVRVRYMWKRAILPNGAYCYTKYEYDQNVDFLVSFTDSAWSDWIPYATRPEERVVTFPDQVLRDALGQRIAYLFAIQAQDTAGAVSIDRTYARTVHNLQISANLTPLLTVQETYLGSTANSSIYERKSYDIAQNQPLRFSWSGTADSYAGSVVAYRYGWDVADPTNPDDPGWALQPGNTPQHRQAPVRAFASGTHTLTVQCFDNSGQETRILIILNVVPVPDLPAREPLLLVDDVIDRNSNAWVGQDGVAYDNDRQRDAFWDEVLAGPGGVINYNSTQNSVDLEQDQLFGYRDIVNYRAVIWAHKKAFGSYVFNKFDPTLGEKYVWLTTFQQQVGNVFLCGQQALQSFIGDLGMVGATTTEGSPRPSAPWMTPIIMDTSEEYYEYANALYALGFGERRLADGTMQPIGPQRYPYLAWGVAALDAASHSLYVYPGPPGVGTTARKGPCIGMKAIVLDPVFKAANVDPGAVADTIYTARVLDFNDYRTPYPTYPRLEDTFAWTRDEFYDRNVTTRATAIVPQQLPDGRAAVEPMWRYYARFDWIDDMHASRGDPGWPSNIYDNLQLRAVCGNRAIALNGRTYVENANVGFVSHKTEFTKPTGRPDVLWGFDPSRFDRAKIRQAVRWVLSEQFGLPMTTP